MKQVAITSGISKIPDNQQSTLVKKPDDFMQLLQQYSQIFDENLVNEELLPQEELSDIDQESQLASEEDELPVSESMDSNDESLETTEIDSKTEEQEDLISEEPLEWLNFIHPHVTASKAAFLGNNSFPMTNEEPLSVKTISEQPIASDLLDQSANISEVGMNEIHTSPTRVPLSTEEKQTTGSDQLLFDSEEKKETTVESTTGSSAKEIATDKLSETPVKSFVSQHKLENITALEKATSDDSFAANNLQQVSTIDFSKLMTKVEQRPTPAEIKTVVDPLSQKIEQLAQTPEKKITLQLVPEKLGKVRIALEVTDQGSRLEFTVEQQQTKQLLSSIKTELEHVLQKQENQLFSVKEISMKETTTHSIEGSELAQGSLSFTSTTDGQAAQQGFSQPQRQTGKKNYNPLPLPKVEVVEQTNHAISILA